MWGSKGQGCTLLSFSFTYVLSPNAEVFITSLKKPDTAGVTSGSGLVPGRGTPTRGWMPSIHVLHPAPVKSVLARRREAMAAVFLPGNLQDEATCSVCLEFFKDPVSIECGHNFCRACIIKSWKDLEMDFPCPQCREVFQQKSFRPNRQLANMSEIISQFTLRGAKGAEEDGLCVKHREALKLYCKDDRRTICVVCDRSREHRPHAVVPVDEASEEYKVHVCLSPCPEEDPPRSFCLMAVCVALCACARSSPCAVTWLSHAQPPCKEPAAAL